MTAGIYAWRRGRFHGTRARVRRRITRRRLGTRLRASPRRSGLILHIRERTHISNTQAVHACGIRARRLVPRTPVLARVFQTLQMSILDGAVACAFAKFAPTLAKTFHIVLSADVQHFIPFHAIVLSADVHLSLRERHPNSFKTISLWFNLFFTVSAHAFLLQRLSRSLSLPRAFDGLYDTHSFCDCRRASRASAYLSRRRMA